jgi:SAM-dependent methyltransferase
LEQEQEMQDSQDSAAAGQITPEAAEIYENFFVPALFGQFARPLAAAAGIGAGQRVLDVASGTGVVARAAAEAGAQVTAVDLNDGMVSVARRRAPTVDFRTAPAEALPFEDAAFDAVTCQFGLMFFADRTRALSEMRRVRRPGGTVAVAVFERWEDSPGYCDLIPLIAEIIGAEAAEALKAPFCLGDRDALRRLLAAGGLDDAEITGHTGVVRHASLDHWLDTEIGGWTIASMVDDAGMAALKSAARDRLGAYAGANGAVAFDAPAIFAVARA